MQWMDVVREMQVVESVGGEAEVRGVQYDSRRVGPEDVFVAMRGEMADGNRHVPGALARGAVAVVTDSAEVFAGLRGREIPGALVERGRRALAEASAAVMGHPERELRLSAVTGTNGKTTTAWVLEQLLRSVGRKSVLVGTIETHVAGEVRESEHTTPESRDLLAVFRDGVDAGCTEAVIEASSHALEQERVWGMPVDVAVWTNLTRDHLDYHGTMDAYFAAKRRLFEGVGTGAPRVAVVNADDPWSTRLLDEVRSAEVMRYGIEAGAYRAEGVELRVGETRFRWLTPAGAVDARTPLTGRVNVYNVLAAGCAAMARGLSLDDVARAAEHLKQVPGRFQVVAGSGVGVGLAGFTVVVDYAHTDDALRSLIALARELVGATGGRVITVFGCGGDRDRGKRAKMGRAAGEGSDLVVVTSDNPRTEAPEAIIREVMVGVEETGADCIVEEERAGAIDIAIRSARAGDAVLIAGKGHERGQIFAEGVVAFDDVAVAAGVLEELR